MQNLHCAAVSACQLGVQDRAARRISDCSTFQFGHTLLSTRPVSHAVPVVYATLLISAPVKYNDNNILLLRLLLVQTTTLPQLYRARGQVPFKSSSSSGIAELAYYKWIVKNRLHIVHWTGDVFKNWQKTPAGTLFHKLSVGTLTRINSSKIKQKK